jgi:hypothetical protein
VATIPEYFNSESSFARHHVDKLNHSYKIPDKQINLNPQIQFKTTTVKIGERVQTYENEIKLILDDESHYNVSFDLENGGECKKLTEPAFWFRNEVLETIVSQNFSLDSAGEIDSP